LNTRTANPVTPRCARARPCAAAAMLSATTAAIVAIADGDREQRREQQPVDHPLLEARVARIEVQRLARHRERHDRERCRREQERPRGSIGDRRLHDAGEEAHAVAHTRSFERPTRSA
jgi:hypothetical protein